MLWNPFFLKFYKLFASFLEAINLIGLRFCVFMLGCSVTCYQRSATNIDISNGMFTGIVYYIVWNLTCLMGKNSDVFQINKYPGNA